MHTLVDTTLQRQTVRRLLEEFVTRTGALIKEPGAFNFGFPYSSNPRREGFSIMEVTDFEVSDNHQTQRLFQQFYDGYDTMGTERDWAILLRDDPPDSTSVPYTGSISVKQAGQNIHYFFHDYSPPRPSLDTKTENSQTPTRTYFTTITMWRSVDAMREWHTEYAANCDDYERLGHPLE
ncbi:hypothetical protein BCON_0317g00010 [Botryotinia convoluta]|uniref:Uncharacterized protein n=1 Tax=Botryotinia convoluta TaxID=54673 RepID=A0A4Z1HBV7_9HELO|nr:hypothetical protein BCON_0317g00010 [Botryotinia convoluta]